VEGDYYRKLAKERTVRNFVIPANKAISILQTAVCLRPRSPITSSVLMHWLKNRSL
jgi:hypothetical protein